MIHERKIAGILVDKFAPQSTVIGFGVNVTNHPDTQDAGLRDTIIRLADLVSQPPSLAILTESILIALRSAMDSMANVGFGALHPRINKLWGGTRRVMVDLDGTQRSGLFTGIDDQGRLLLQDDALRITSLEPHQVKLLRELTIDT